MARPAIIPEIAIPSRHTVQVRALAPRRFAGVPDAPAVGVAGWTLRVLPTRTRPSLFGSD